MVFKTKSSPFGTVEDPFVLGQLVLGSRGTFFARSIDGNMKMSQEIFTEAAKHEGTSVVEVLQNYLCDFQQWNTRANYKLKTVKNHKLYLKHGEKMIFGVNRDKGIVSEKGKIESSNYRSRRIYY